MLPNLDVPGDAISVARSIRTREKGAVSLLEETLRRLEKSDSVLNSVTKVYEVSAHIQARDIDSLLASGQSVGELGGVPFGIKDLFDVAGYVTTAGSIIERGNQPAIRSADVVERLVEAGAIPAASLAMDEYAHGFTTNNPHTGICRNPHDHRLIAGGSSGGSAAAVASGDLSFSLGSDTNGSVRVPASLCGVFGFKPSYGRVSTRGMVPFAASLDHVGVFTRSVRDAAIVTDVISADEESLGAIEGGIGGIKIARVATHVLEPYAASAAIRAVAVAGDALGANVSVELPPLATAMHASLLITAIEGGAHHLQNLRSRIGDFGAQARAGLTAGALLPAIAYANAKKYRAWYVEQLSRLFDDFDVLLLPTTPTSAPRIGQSVLSTPANDLEVDTYLGIFTIPFSLAGFPVMSVPIKPDEGMPLGVQVVGRSGGDACVLRVSAQLEQLGVTDSKGAIQ